MYEVVGDLAAPSYFWVDSNGNVYVRQSLKSDITMQYVVSSHIDYTLYLFSKCC